MTYNGQFEFTYDAWNRMTGITRAYRDSSGDLQTGSIVTTSSYDALGRRITKAIGDPNAPGLMGDARAVADPPPLPPDLIQETDNQDWPPR